jgi:hypothetical protein
MIDAHHHLWDLAAREHRWLMGGQPWATDAELAGLRRSFRLADFAPLAAASSVTGTVVIQTVAEPWETPDLLALAAGGDPYAAGNQGPGTELPSGGEPAGGHGDELAGAGGLLAGVVGWTDLTAPAVEDAVASLRALPGGSFLSGIRRPVLGGAHLRTPNMCRAARHMLDRGNHAPRSQMADIADSRKRRDTDQRFTGAADASAFVRRHQDAFALAASGSPSSRSTWRPTAPHNYALPHCCQNARIRKAHAAPLFQSRCCTMLMTFPSGARTKNRRTPHGSVVIG